LAVGQLRDKDGKPFEFDVYRKRQRNQRRYEQLGEVIVTVQCNQKVAHLVFVKEKLHILISCFVTLQA